MSVKSGIATIFERIVSDPQTGAVRQIIQPRQAFRTSF